MDNITIYDNGGVTLDRYTVIYNDERRRDPVTGAWLYQALGMSEDGAGYSEHCEAIKGRHLGKIVPWGKLKRDTQDHIIYRMEEY